MKLNPDHLGTLEALAIRAATQAGEMIQSRVQHDHRVLPKTGGSSFASQVVTAVDLESQRIILETLEESFSRYELGLLTEESPDDASRHAHDHFWCIDPLDGTLAFTNRSHGYSVSIALVARDGTPRLGVVYDPVTADLYHAVHQQGARKNGSPWHPAPAPTSLPGTPGTNLTLLIDHSFRARAKEPTFQAWLEALALQSGCDGTRIIDHAGAVLNACWVVERAPALYFKLPKPEPGGGSLWDFAATACLFNELGLPATDMHGQRLHFNPEGDTFMNHRGVLFVSDPELASAVMVLRS